MSQPMNGDRKQKGASNRLGSGVGFGPKRDRKPNGQYDHERMDKLCVCGRTLGEHDAAYPHPDNETGGHLCQKFRTRRAK